MAGTPDLNLLPLFVAVAETWSMSEAARRLGVPKSSVSRGVAALEASLGVQLFHRTTRQVALTTAGTAFYDAGAAGAHLPPGGHREPARTGGRAGGGAAADRAGGHGAHLAASPAGRLRGALSVRPARHAPHEPHGRSGGRGLRRGAAGLRQARGLRRWWPAGSRGWTWGSSPRRPIWRGAGTPGVSRQAAALDWCTHASTRLLPEPLGSVRARLASDDLLFVHRAVREGIGLGILPTFLARRTSRGRLVAVLPGGIEPAETSISSIRAPSTSRARSAPFAISSSTSSPRGRW